MSPILHPLLHNQVFTLHNHLFISLLFGSMYACEQLFLRMKHWKNKIKLKIFDRLLEKSLRIATTSTEPDTVFFFLWKYCIKLKYPTSFLLLLPSFFICFKEKILKNMRCCHLPTYIKYIYIFFMWPMTASALSAAQVSQKFALNDGCPNYRS